MYFGVSQLTFVVSLSVLCVECGTVWSVNLVTDLCVPLSVPLWVGFFLLVLCLKLCV